jgi:hypothetical protein
LAAVVDAGQADKVEDPDKPFSSAGDVPAEEKIATRTDWWIASANLEGVGNM